MPATRPPPGRTGSDAATIQQFAQHFAIVLDGELQSTPYIDYKQNPDGIDPTGTAPRSRTSSSIGEAKDLALVLQTGALPVEFAADRAHRRSRRRSARTRSSEAQARRADRPARRRDLPARASTASSASSRSIGLGIYAAFLYAAILLFNVTLTLPGFAGLILTIGVAADANVVIFERIKEEVRAGKSVRAAISAGYAKGFHTIIDANVVTRDHGAGAVRGRDRGREGLRADAADRHRRSR